MPKPPQRLHPREAEGRPFQYSDMTSANQRVARERWADLGNVASNLPTIKASAEASLDRPDVRAITHVQAQRRLQGVEAAEPHAVDKPLSLTSAAKRQVVLSHEAARRGSTTGDIRSGAAPSGMPVGAGWYFDHAKDLDYIARGTGFDTSRIIDASVAMSPQNDPANEKAAIAALATAHSSDHWVTAKSSQGAKMLGVADIGMAKRFSELTPEQIVGISGSAGSGHVASPANLYDMAKGGSGLREGIQVLRGEKDPETIGKDTGKVPSYRASIQAAHDATPAERGEYFRRVSEGLRPEGSATSYHGGSDTYEQHGGTLFGSEWEANPWSEAQSSKGILDPRHHTAQDTWMQAMNLNQPAEAVAYGQKGSGRVGKFLASDPSMRMSPEGLYPTARGSKNLTGAEILHAMGNEATIRSAAMVTRSAERQGRNMGAGLPSVAMQEIPWSEYRIGMGKDPQWAKAEAIMGSEPPRQEIKGQGSMFTPSGGVTKAAGLPKADLVMAHQEAFLANEKTARRRSNTADQRATARGGAQRNRSFLEDNL